MEPLKQRGFNFQKRGETYVKGFKNQVKFDSSKSTFLTKKVEFQKSGPRNFDWILVRVDP